ncbi:ABC transporter permease [Halomonas salifodinae]|uniref:ABC transporter permease n=1 Tax=Halomonas salifodinae TaxID=438745 RepID=A0ABW2EVX8_9GAMM
MHEGHDHITLMQVLTESIGNLNLSGRRSLLALLGIMVGSGSIIALLIIGGSGTEEAMRTFRHMGTDTLIVNFPSRMEEHRPVPAHLDTLAMRAALPEIAEIAPLSHHSGRISYAGKYSDASLVGATGGMAPAIGLQLREGRHLSRYDRREAFAVVGARVAEELGAPGRPLRIGDRIRIEHYLFEVIGIAKPWPANPLIPISADDAVLVPLEGMRRLHPAPQINAIIVRGGDAELTGLAQALRAYMQELWQRAVDVQIPRQLLDGLQQQANTFAYLLAGLGGISLLVGGVGVMNVMLMSVAERKREIGIRMALGARRRDIRRLFLLEAVNLSLLGALLGAALGLTVAYGFVRFSHWDFHMAREVLPLGVGGALLAGIFFGLYPAFTASRLQPVEALRAE